MLYRYLLRAARSQLSGMLCSLKNIPVPPVPLSHFLSHHEWAIEILLDLYIKYTQW